jgi:hypothetical protein
MSMLESFDKNRERILEAAHKAYQGRRKGSHQLDGSDFE